MIKRTIAKLSNKARIKKLFKILNGQNEKFLHFFGISTPTDKDVDEQILEEKYRNFMQDIEKNGLIDYFLQNMNNNVENADVYKFCLILCEYISNKSIVKKIIEDMIYSSAVDEVVALIKATEDPEYIKEKWLKDVKKMHALGIYGDRAVALIKATGDPEYIKECIELENESDLENFIAETKIIQGTRYSGINYVNVGEEEKNTIEFRLPNGTLDPTTWIENINLFGGLVRVSHELSEIMLKSEEQRTEEEKKMLYNYEVIQTEQDERKVAEALIGLCVSQEQMQTYLDRYDENSELLEKTPKINDGLKGQIRKNKIGKKTIPKINGVDLEEFSREVSKELEIINEREGESIDVK